MPDSRSSPYAEVIRLRVMEAVSITLDLGSVRNSMVVRLVLMICVQSASISYSGSGQMILFAIYKVPGAVAQLGERLICIQEVAGSIPTSSTSLIKHDFNLSMGL